MIILPTTIGWWFLLLTWTRLHLLSFMMLRRKKKRKLFREWKISRVRLCFLQLCSAIKKWRKFIVFFLFTEKNYNCCRFCHRATYYCILSLVAPKYPPLCQYYMVLTSRICFWPAWFFKFTIFLQRVMLNLKEISRKNSI